MMLISERKIDPLGRLVIPAEMRARLQILAGDSVRILFDEKKIVTETIRRL